MNWLSGSLVSLRGLLGEVAGSNPTKNFFFEIFCRFCTKFFKDVFVQGFESFVFAFFMVFVEYAFEICDKMSVVRSSNPHAFEFNAQSICCCGKKFAAVSRPGLCECEELMATRVTHFSTTTAPLTGIKNIKYSEIVTFIKEIGIA